jgi:hypothetical protein
LAYLDEVFIPSRNRVFSAAVKKLPWITHLTEKIWRKEIRFGVQILNDGHIIEEWTLVEKGVMITGWEKGINNLAFTLLGIKLKLVIRNEKTLLENWVQEEADLMKRPFSKSLKYIPKLLAGIRFHKN